MTQSFNILLLLFLCTNGFSKADNLGPILPMGVGSDQLIFVPTFFKQKTNQFVTVFSSFINSTFSLVYYIHTPNGIQISTGILSTPGVRPSCCYNSQDDTVLVAYRYGPIFYYMIMSGDMSKILVGPVSISEAKISIACAYNSKDNQFIIALSRNNSEKIFYMIIDNRGNTVVPLTEVAGSVNTSPFNINAVSYNAANNQYCLSWVQQGSPNKPAFTVINADGSTNIGITLIPTVSSNITLLAPVISSYNNTNNQYIIVYNDGSNNGYFTIYDALGSAVIPEIRFSTNLYNFTYRGSYVSYNPQNNEYLISWIANDTRRPTMRFYNTQGLAVSAEIVLSNSSVTNISTCYSPTEGTFFIAYIRNSAGSPGACAIYTRTPVITTVVNATGQRLLNHFSNYGYYFKRLNWPPSTVANLTGYQIYKNGVFIANVPPYQTQYDDNDSSAFPQVYGVSVATSAGLQSLYPLVYV